MKIIELLNRIANNEEIPKKIKFDNIIFEYDGDYYSSKHNVLLEEYCHLTTSLNDEVEIIEDKPFNERVEEIYNRHIDYIYNKEDKKIKKIQSCGDNLYSEYIGQWLVNKEDYTEYDELLMNKINEIIDKINEEGK